MLIDTTYFVGEILIPGLTGDNIIVTGTVEEVNRFIKKYEKDYLLHVLGEDLYEVFTSGLTAEPLEERFTNLRARFIDQEILSSPIADYVYYHIMRDRMSETTGSGEAQAALENSTSTINTDKMVRAYNSAVRSGRWIRTWIANRTAIYPEFKRSGNYVLKPINSFGL